MRSRSRGRPSLARRAGNRRGRRRGGGEARGDWSTRSGLEGAAEINGGVVQQVGGGDLLRDNGGRSGSETTGRAAPSKRRRATGSSSHSTPELRPSSSTTQPRARMDPDEQPGIYGGFDELLMSGMHMSWPEHGGLSPNAVPGEAANPVPLAANTTTDTSNQGRKKVYAGKRLSNFSPNEDKLLVRSYLEVSCDALVSTNQKKEGLWTRIMKQYNENRGHYPERTMRSAQSRWDTIKLEVGKFCGYYSEVMHCWEIMKDEPKWQETKQTKGSCQTPYEAPTDPFMAPSPSVGTNSPSAGTSSGKRPLGRDATKAARKKTSSASSSSVGAEFTANLKELNLTKTTQWDQEYARRSSRDHEFVALEKEHLDMERMKHEDIVSLQRRQLELEEEKVKMQRTHEEERILAIDLASVPNERLRAYYKKMQDKIMENV